MSDHKGPISFAPPTQNESAFFKELREEIKLYFKSRKISPLANTRMWMRAIFFFTAYAATWISLTFLHPDPALALFLCVFLGFLGTGIALNVGHESSHHNYSQKTWLNEVLYFISMNLIGTYSYLWKVGHISTHHTLVNIPGRDVGADANHVLRFTTETPLKPRYRYQHFYAPFLYCTYSITWVLFRDWRVYFSGVMANHRFQRTPMHLAELIFIKIFYFYYMLILPIRYSGYEINQIIIGFLVIHIVLSLYVAALLFTSHLNSMVQFPEPIQGKVTHSYIRHQFLTTLDIHPESKVANFFLGGFNSHVIHHLFPNISAIHYPELMKILKKLSAKYDLPYLEGGIRDAVIGHFKFLKKMATQSK